MIPPRGKLPVTTICVLLFMTVFYLQRLGFLSSASNIFMSKPCPGNNTKPESGKFSLNYVTITYIILFLAYVVS